MSYCGRRGQIASASADPAPARKVTKSVNSFPGDSRIDLHQPVLPSCSPSRRSFVERTHLTGRGSSYTKATDTLHKTVS